MFPFTCSCLNTTPSNQDRNVHIITGSQRECWHLLQRIHIHLCVSMCLFWGCFKVARDVLLAKEPISCGLLYSPEATYNSHCHKCITNRISSYTYSRKILVYWTEFSTMSQKPKSESRFLVSTSVLAMWPWVVTRLPGLSLLFWKWGIEARWPEVPSSFKSKRNQAAMCAA